MDGNLADIVQEAHQPELIGSHLTQSKSFGKSFTQLADASRVVLLPLVLLMEGVDDCIDGFSLGVGAVDELSGCQVLLRLLDRLVDAALGGIQGSKAEAH
ncbi:hypothetical protein DSECCO2_509530 [anaerobic digester metagenome]